MDVNARRRLNIAYVNGCLVIAGVIGLGPRARARSWPRWPY
jgi:hypothetical protein